MPKTIKIRCNGPDKHINEFDENEFKKILGNTIVIHRGSEDRHSQLDLQSIPERIVISCKECTYGKVIITRKVIKEVLQDKN